MTAPASAVRPVPTLSGSGALAQVRETVQGLERDGRHSDALEFLLAALAAVLQKSRDLELLVATLRRAGLGTRSERVNPEQLALLLDEWLKRAPHAADDPDALARDDAALTHEIEHAEAQAVTPRVERTSWRTSAQVERVVHTHDVPEAEKTCAVCGREKKCPGYDERQDPWTTCPPASWCTSTGWASMPAGIARTA